MYKIQVESYWLLSQGTGAKNGTPGECNHVLLWAFMETDP